MRRRALLRIAFATMCSAGGLPAITALSAPVRITKQSTTGGNLQDVVEASIDDLQAAMVAGRISAVELTQEYVNRIQSIDRAGPSLNSILEVNPDALSIAADLDEERGHTGPRSPLHGIPILLKDNIETADAMQTTAGSWALLHVPVAQDSTTAARLRQAGAIILGKTNLSEWANFRSTRSSSGWSGRGGQCNMPYLLDHNPCGSSSGSAAATSASLAAAAIGTETDGSIVCPAHANGVVGIKPTVGLTSRAGVIPVSHTQDTVGPFGRTVADAARLLGVLVGVDQRDPSTTSSDGHLLMDYTPVLNGSSLQDARIGVARNLGFGIDPRVDVVVESALNAMRTAGARLMDVVVASADETAVLAAELDLLLFDFKADITTYLQGRPGGPQTLTELIAYNQQHAALELPWFGQELFEMAQMKDLADGTAYQRSLTASQARSRADLDQIISANALDALVAPTGSPAWITDLVHGDPDQISTAGPSARAGYPVITVPAGQTAEGLPVGISFLGGPWSEPRLLGLAFAFEQATRARETPRFLASGKRL